MNRIILLLTAVSVSLTVSAVPPDFDMDAYQAQPGLTAEVANDVLTVIWEGAHNEKFKLEFIINQGVPVIRTLDTRNSAGAWRTLLNGVAPEFRVVSGMRRVTQQQTEPLEKLGIPLTPEKLDDIKWDAFWDAPLYIEDKPPLSHGSSIPAAEAFANHPGMPRKPDEVVRATARYRATGCNVRTDGARITVTFPGAEAGIFTGYLQYDVFKGSNLIRQMLVAKTDHPSAAFKYDAGLTGLTCGPSSHIVWRDLGGHWQDYKLGGPVNAEPVTIYGRNRLIAAELSHGAVALFPPPHRFYWARETEQNLGYGWYRKDSGEKFSLGVRQAEKEENPEFLHNFALYSARPGTWQRMPVFIYIGTESAPRAIDEALEFTHGDRFKPLPGYKVMGHHYHVGLVKRLNKQGGFDQRLNDMETMQSIGIDIFSVVDGVRGPGRHDRGELFLKDLYDYYQAAVRQSDTDFLVMPNDENSTGGRPPFLGGHYDILFSKPVYWHPRRDPGQPLFETHPKYGRVYHIGSPADLMEMTEKENALISLPHPNTKRSTGYPHAIMDQPHFLHENYFSLGYRWGMGIDASEKRLGEYRFLKLWDDTNNRMAAQGRPPKYALAISEIRSDKGERGRPPYDDAYGMSPVNYVKIDAVPGIDDMSPVIGALKQGDYFVTSGEVLIPFYEIVGEGNRLTITAKVQWTFPLDFVEIVWGDGEKTGRRVVKASELPPFGSKRFEIPFNAAGQKWVRFAAWDVAANGALVQPVFLGTSGLETYSH